MSRKSLCAVMAGAFCFFVLVTPFSSGQSAPAATDQELDTSSVTLEDDDATCYEAKWLRDDIWVAKRAAGMLPDYPPLDQTDSERTRQYKRTTAAEKVVALQAKMPAIQAACKVSAARAAAEAAEKARVAKLPGVRIGMSKKQVLTRTSWGAPDSVNTTTTAHATTEQWVYGDGQYLYFTNGKLTAIQD